MKHNKDEGVNRPGENGLQQKAFVCYRCCYCSLTQNTGRPARSRKPILQSHGNDKEAQCQSATPGAIVVTGQNNFPSHRKENPIKDVQYDI